MDSDDALKEAAKEGERAVLDLLSSPDFDVDDLTQPGFSIAMGISDDAIPGELTGRGGGDIADLLEDPILLGWSGTARYLPRGLSPSRWMRVLTLCSRPEVIAWMLDPGSFGQQAARNGLDLQAQAVVGVLKLPPHNYWEGVVMFLRHLGLPWLPEGMPQRRQPVGRLAEVLHGTRTYDIAELDEAWRAWCSIDTKRLPGWDLTRTWLAGQLSRGMWIHQLVARMVAAMPGSLEPYAALLGATRAALGASDLSGVLNPFEAILG
jgi:hypothetical protein